MTLASFGLAEATAIFMDESLFLLQNAMEQM